MALPSIPGRGRADATSDGAGDVSGDLSGDVPGSGEIGAAPLAGTAAQAMQRLQVGVAGLVAMVLLVGIANIVIDQARETDASTVPQAAATAEAPAKQNDPLADAGIVPDLPKEAEDQPVPDGPVLPEQGAGATPAE